MKNSRLPKNGATKPDHNTWWGTLKNNAKGENLENALPINSGCKQCSSQGIAEFAWYRKCSRGRGAFG